MSQETPDRQKDPLGWLESRGLWQGALFRSMLEKARDGDRLPEGTRLGPWRITGELGAGGMAVVYRARRDDGQFDQEVAVKCVPANPSLRDLELFRRERQIQAALNHPNIARLLDGGTLDNDRAWFAMELVDGKHIDDHAVAAGLDLPSRVRLVLQVVAAVSWAHQRLLLHRDIKPSNVLVDTEGRVKLLDFGIAGWIDERSQVHAYSPGWASPEQRRNDPVGPASDQFQIGQLLARLAGTELEGKGLECSELRAIAAKAREDNPVDRYHSVAELGADLERWLDRAPVHASKGGWSYVLWCAIRRRPWLSAGIAATLVLGLGLVSAFSWRLNQEFRRAERAGAIAQNVNQFLTDDLLSQADPYVAPSRDLRVRDLLDRARVSIGNRFEHEPGIEAGIRATLARSYTGIGDFPNALTEYDSAITLAERDPATTIEALTQLRGERAEARFSLGEHADAAFTEMAALESAERKRVGKDSRLQILLRVRTIQMMITASKSEEALAEVDALVPRLAILAEGDSLRTELRAAEGEAAMRLAQFDRAETALVDAEARTRALRGDDSPWVIRIVQNRAILNRQKGDFKKAIDIERDVLTWQETRFGRNHPETQRTLNELASMLQDDRQFEAAEAMFREVLAMREETLGVGDVLTRNSLNNLGLVLSLQNKLDEAEKHYRRAFDVERELLGADALDVLILAHNLAGLLRKRGDLPGALKLAEDTVERADRTLGESRYEPALFRVGLAQTLQRLGRYDEADASFVRARARLAGIMGEDHARVQKIDEMRAALEAERRPDRH